MTSLLTWASSMAQAVLSTISPEQPPPPPVVVPQKVTGFRTAKAKAKAAAKKKRQQKLAAAKRRTANTNQDGEEQDVDTEQPSADVSTEVIRGEDEDEDDVETTPPSPPTIDEERAKRRLALEAKKEKQREKNRLKRELKEQQLAESMINTPPPDPMASERQRLSSEVETQFQEIIDLKTLTPTNLRMQFPDVQRSLEDLINLIDNHIREMNRKVPRVNLEESVTVEKLKNEIIKIEFSNNRDELLFSRKIEQLSSILSAENHKEWVNSMMTFKDKVEKRRDLNRRLLTQANEIENRERIAGRLQTLISVTENKQVDIDKAALVNRPADLTAQVSAVLYQPHNLLRKFEKKFSVVCDNPPRLQSDGPRRTGGPRTIIVWGVDAETVQEAVSHLNTALVERKQFPRNMVGAIIGRNGTGIARLEQESGALLNVDGSQEVTVVAFGDDEERAALWSAIDKLNVEPQETQVTSDMPIDPLIARAIQGLHRAKLQGVEADTKSRITVISNPNDGSVPRILIRTRPDAMERARRAVKSALIDGYVHLDFEGPQRAVSRLLVPPRNASETAQNRLLHDEFRALRESLALFVDRLGPRPPRAGEAPVIIDEEEEQPSGLAVVCHSIDLETVKEKVSDLITRASYIIARVPIEREQLRIFTADNRALIEASSGTRVSVNATPNGAFFNVVGSHSAIENAKKVVAEILEREGKVVHFKFDETEVMTSLLRDRGARIRALENEYNVSISIYRDRQEATLVGDQEGLSQCTEALQEMCNERKQRRANVETLQLTIEASKIGQIIGRQGSTINDICQTSECDSIQIPNNRDPDAQEITISIIGLKQSVQVAQKMIERILNVNSSQQPSRQHSDEGREEAAPRYRGRGRGRGRQGQGPGPSRYGPPQEQPKFPAGQVEDDEDFPALGSAGGGAPPAAVVPDFEVEDVDPAELEMAPFGGI